jgi:hypothetical protein
MFVNFFDDEEQEEDQCEKRDRMNNLKYTGSMQHHE